MSLVETQMSFYKEVSHLPGVHQKKDNNLKSQCQENAI